jgi:1,4-dihydroxy-6-naphthoate synthase
VSDARTLAVGFSPCPNDTFMFHGLVSGDVKVDGLRFRAQMEDIEKLNLRAMGGESLPVTKLSLPALAEVADRYALLRTGAALGRGCGPVVVRRADRGELVDLQDLVGKRIAIPGRYTTAHLLLRIFAPGGLDVREMRFDRIMPAVAEGKVDAGVIIHESRFSFRDHGLVEMRDLGDAWEESSGLPIPLGVIAARRELERGLVERIENGLGASIEAAFADPARSRSFIREHAHELSDSMCRQHIELYVNRFSVDMGEEGKLAVDELLARGQAAQLLPREMESPWR